MPSYTIVLRFIPLLERLTFTNSMRYSLIFCAKNYKKKKKKKKKKSASFVNIAFDIVTSY